MAQGGLTFNGQVVGIEASVAQAWKRVEAQKYSFKPTLDPTSFGIRSLTDDTSKFNNELNRATNRVLSFATAGAVFLTFSRGLKELVSSTINVEQSLARINVNLGQSAQGLRQFSASLFDIARNTGSTFDDVAKAAEELARQGLNATETLKRLKDASVLARIAGIDTTEAVTGLTAAVNTFSKEALTTTEIVAKLAAVDTRFAVSSKDLTEGISRVGSAASEAGVSFNELIAVITAVQQSTQRGGAVIGNALKSIFQRVSRPESLEDLQKLGVVVKDVNNNFLPGLVILKNLATAYDGLGQSAKASISEQLGGIFQVNILKAAVRDLASETSIYGQALKTATNASVEAHDKNEELNKTLASSLNATGASIKQLFSSIGNQSLSPIVKGVLDNVQQLQRYLSGSSGDKLGEALGDGLLRGISNVLSGPALVGSLLAIGGALKKVLGSVATDIKGLLGINSLTEQRATVLGRIQKLMEQATAAEASQVATASTLLGQKEAILAISIRIAQAEEAAAAASAAQASLFIQGGRITLPRVGRAAGGYLPAIGNETKAIAAGVGGASPGARPVVISNFAFGGGVFGPIVANSDEHIVRNYANGGDAIFNPHMAASLGLPAGAKKLSNAAGGYVPNAAVGGLGDIRSAGGQFVSAADLRNLESLFGAVRAAGDGVQARELGRNVLDFSEKLNKVSQQSIRDKLGVIYDAFDKGIPQAVREGIRRAAVSNRGDFASTQIPTSLSEIALQNATIRHNVNLRGGNAAFNDFNPSPVASINQAFSGQTAFDPNRVRGTRSVVQSIRSGIRNPNALLGASIALPLLAGFVPEGQGGTGAGIGFGALRGAAIGAGTGAIFGPEGALIGAGIGALVGAFSKATKSVDEFAAGLTDAKTKNALTSLYALSRGGSVEAAAANVAPFVSQDSLKGLDIRGLGEASRFKFNASPIAVGDTEDAAASTDFSSGTFAQQATYIKKTQEALKRFGLNFEVTSENLNDAAATALKAASLASIAAKKDAAKNAADEIAAAKAGLPTDSFLTRGQGFSALTALGGIRRGGLKNQFERAHVIRQAYESIAETGAVGENFLKDNKDYLKVKGLDQAQNAQAYLANYLESKLPGARFHQGERFFLPQIGQSLARLGAVGTSLKDEQLTPEQRFNRSLYNDVYTRAQNTLTNVGGVIPSPFESEGGVTTGIKSETHAPGDKLITALDGFVKAVDKLTAHETRLTLQLDGSILVEGEGMTEAEKQKLAAELMATTHKHFVTKAEGHALNAKLGALNKKPLPPAAFTPGSQSLPAAPAQSLSYPGASKGSASQMSQNSFAR